MKFTASTVAISYTAAALLTFGKPVVGAEGDNLVSPYGETFTGEGTYYGEIPASAGNCAIQELPSMYSGMIPVAINGPQYDNAMMCGACIEGTGSGNGSGSNPITGTFKAFVSDQCPECAWGDLDFAQSGDGRWEIEWQFVPCEGGGNPTFNFEGSNSYYWKIQPVGTISPVNELFVNGKLGQKTDDNFWIVEEGGPFYGEQVVETNTILSGYYTNMVAL